MHRKRTRDPCFRNIKSSVTFDVAVTSIRSRRLLVLGAKTAFRSCGKPRVHEHPLRHRDSTQRQAHLQDSERERKGWRRGSESNRRIKVLQTSPLPLGYRALKLRYPQNQELSTSSLEIRSHSKTPSWGGLRSDIWSGRRDLNPRLRPWQGRTLPLSYSRS